MSTKEATMSSRDQNFFPIGSEDIRRQPGEEAMEGVPKQLEHLSQSTPPKKSTRFIERSKDASPVRQTDGYRPPWIAKSFVPKRMRLPESAKLEATVGKFLFGADIFHRADVRLCKRALVAFRLEDAATGQDDPAAGVIFEVFAPIQNFLKCEQTMVVDRWRVDRVKDTVDFGGQFRSFPIMNVTSRSTRTRQPPPSSISIIPALGRCAGGEDGCGPNAGAGAGVEAISTGTRAGTASPPRRPWRACRRQVNSRLCAIPCRRATPHTVSPARNVSSIRRTFSS
jgi:hypothetical protein